MTGQTALLWFRRDLRLHDNAALAAALAGGRAVVPVFVLDETTPGAWAPGGASRWWLHHSLESLGADLAKRGSRLVLRRGAYAEVLPELLRETGASEIHTGEPTEPWARRAVDSLGQTLPIRRHRTALLFHPSQPRTGSGTPYGVYTPYSRACLAAYTPHPAIPAPARMPKTPLPRSDALGDWGLLPTQPDWAGGLRQAHRPGEAGAAARLQDFLPRMEAYDEQRNLPGIPATSTLSPHLAWGEISPDEIWRATEAVRAGKGRDIFRNELLWREFFAHLLWHFPALPDAPLKPAYAEFPWRDDPQALRAWQRGETGYPIVDAGMRQLWQTGWMHNRVRMIVASFLIKHLLIPWQAGEAWFWDTLVDADLAANAASWQWVAGSGADAAPFFRIFNPVLQGLKFDPDGAYVRRFVPELAGLPTRHVHAPWEADSPPRNYPKPIVDLAFGRQRALDALKIITKSAA
jgi:deoxyribodipyrimidine photo-lyase